MTYVERAKLSTNSTLLLKEQHPQQAAIHLQRYSTLKDSLYTRETANRLAANDAEYRAQQLLAESAKEKSQHLIHIIVFTLFMVILIATTTFVLLRKRKHKGEDYVAITNHQEQTVDGETQEADEKFAQTLRYEIEQRLTEGMINLEELASAMYMSRGQLNRRVKALTGSNHLPATSCCLRLDMACKSLLSNSPTSLSTKWHSNAASTTSRISTACSSARRVSHHPNTKVPAKIATAATQSAYLKSS